MFSSRLPVNPTENRLARVRTRLDAGGVDVVDLTESNPTRVGLAYPPDLLASFADRKALVYAPSPCGLPEARGAVAEHLSGGQLAVDPGRVVLTASTSEAYSCLFKLLCDPGDRVMVPPAELSPARTPGAIRGRRSRRRMRWSTMGVGKSTSTRCERG